MSGAATSNWPVKIDLTKLPVVILGEELPLYHLLGTMNEEQAATLMRDGRLPEHTTRSLAVSDTVTVVSAVLTTQQLKAAYEQLEGPSKTWRGKYYAVSKAFVDAYRAAGASL